MKLSVIIPAYNEDRRIAATLSDVTQTLSGNDFDYEIIVVDDGSKDGTARVIENLRKEIPKLSLIDNKENHGKGWVVQQGMRKAVGDIRLFMDADNSTKVGEIFNMLPYFEQGFDVVVGSRYVAGSRIAVRQPQRRIFLGKLWRLLVHALVPLLVVDSQCGFKAFTSAAAEKIFPKQTVFRWAFDVEILLLAKRAGHKIKEVPITWKNDSESHIKFSGMMNMLWEIVKIKFS